jgi:mono/diheme cytochrome c family protein/uncharacterized membrane protein
VHLPIGILLIGLLFQWISRIEKYSQLRVAVPALLFFGAISAAFSCITGYVLSLSGEYDGSTLDWHMWMGIGVLVVAIALFVKVNKSRVDLLYKILAIGLFVLISATGHLGGTLTHGSDYLSLAWTSGGSEAEVKKIIPDVQQAEAYADIVQPILQNKCYNCHGPNKQKGKYRMDRSEDLIKGGKEGSAIVAGNAEESEIIRRLLLPKEDKHHMAPSGRSQLTENEISLLHWWIEKGADFEKLVKDIEQSETIKPMLLALQSDQQKKEGLPIIPVEEVKAASENDIQKLKDAGLVVMPVAQNSNYLMVNFVMAPQAGDQEVELLTAIKEQLVWLKMGDTKITDAALAIIGTFPNLIQLQLNNTKVSDIGMESLKSLQRLQSLSLVGTEVTESGVRMLSEIKDLQWIYLYQTAVDKATVEELQGLFAVAKLDTGGYIVPILPSDTTLVKQ